MSQKIDVSIISSGANIADARLHRLTNALLRQGLTVEIFAPGNPADAPAITQAENGEFYPASTPLIVRSCTTPWTRGKGFLPRYIRSRTFVFRARGKVIYAISPEAFMPAYSWVKLRNLLLINNSRRKFAVDLYEDYIRLLQDRAWTKKYFGLLGVIAKSDTRSALWAASRADLTTVADIQVPPFDAKNRLVVRNLPDLSLLTDSGERSTTPRAIYIGDMRRSRGLAMMLDVTEKATRWEFDLVGPIAPADQEFVKDWIASHSDDAAGRVRFHGKLPPRDAWKFAQGAWVGLSLLEQTPAFVEAVPSKLYEYMAIGLATISTPLPRCIKLIDASGGGAIAASSDDVANQLENWLENPKDLDAVRTRARQWAKENLDSAAEYGRFAEAIELLTQN